MTTDPAKNWYWELNDGEHATCLELYNEKGVMLAFIKERPGYCDRGHFQVTIEIGFLGLDVADGRDLMYYMDLEKAMWETVEFLVWRMHKVSYQHPKGGIRAFCRENMPGGVMIIHSAEYQSTCSPNESGPKTIADAAPELEQMNQTHRNVILAEHEIHDPAARKESVQVDLEFETPQQAERRKELVQQLNRDLLGYFPMDGRTKFVVDASTTFEITNEEARQLSLESAVEAAKRRVRGEQHG